MTGEMIDRENLVWVEMECALCKVDLSGNVFERFYHNIKTNQSNKWINGKLQDICSPCKDMKKRNKWIEREIERVNNEVKLGLDEKQKQIEQLEIKKNKRVVKWEHVISTLRLHKFDVVKKRFKECEYKPIINDYIKMHSQYYSEHLIRLGLGEYIGCFEKKEY